MGVSTEEILNEVRKTNSNVYSLEKRIERLEERIDWLSDEIKKLQYECRIRDTLG